jgi:hypothetical protein
MPWAEGISKPVRDLAVGGKREINECLGERRSRERACFKKRSDLK